MAVAPVQNDEFVTGGMDSETRVFTWKIENFEKIRTSDDLIRAQKVYFQVGSSIGMSSEWCCLLLPETKVIHGIVEERAIRIDVKLDTTPAGVRDVFAGFQVKVQPEFFDRESKIRNFVGRLGPTGCGWSDFVSHDEKVPLVDGCLLVEVKLTVYKPKATPLKEESLPDIQARYRAKFSEKLQEDLAKILSSSSSEKSDAVTKILSKDDQEFEVSRVILTARSPVFERMFLTEMIETTTGIVHVTDLSSKTIAVLLRFIYTATLHQDWRDDDVIVELVRAADKYHLSDLLEYLDQVLGIVCSKENAGKLLYLAAKMSLKKAEKDLFDYMKNHVSTYEELVSFVTDGSGNV